MQPSVTHSSPPPMASPSRPAREHEEEIGEQCDDDLNEQDDQQPVTGPQGRRRVQQAIFDAYLESDAAKKVLKAKSKDQKLKDAKDEELSIHSLMAKDGTKIISSPRDYQMELFERAKQENTIAVLDTGSGKTLIAVMLIRHIIDQELEDRDRGKSPRISFFLVAFVTLVYQQFSVLETNLDHKIARVCGADHTEKWDNVRWIKFFSDHQVIVCTADILLQCLSFGYITMKQINLLIFDEAHHTKKNHAYARIIKDHYLGAIAEDQRPRVFGMTASPIDAKADVDEAAIALESLLNAKIATTTDMSFQAAVKRPDEKILRYEALPLPFETQLLRTVKARFGEIEELHDIFKKCPQIARELGEWCADQYLIDSLAEKHRKKLEMTIERKFYIRSPEKDVKVLDGKQANLKSAFDYMADQFTKLSIGRAVDISPKVRQLQTYLAYQFERPTSQRCIVFVEKRYTARLLHALFKQIGSKHLKSAFLIGNSPKDTFDTVSHRSQVMTLVKFRHGEFNCLFATSVAEEGLDVPDCNLVIRFDMYRTMIQYVQSRGRARQANSKFIHMLEMGNTIHEQTTSEVRWQEKAMRKFCQSLPEDRRLIGQEENLETLLEKEKNLREFIDPKSGAKLTYHNCLSILATYVATLPTDGEEPLLPSYLVSSKGAKFVGEVLLPPGAALRSMVGRIHTRKTLAKRSAAFDACLELRRKGHLDENLMSTQRKRTNSMRNAQIALTKCSNKYTMQLKPRAWESGGGSLPTKLYVTVIDIPNGLDRKHQPLALLTRTKMPKFPTFPLFLMDSRETKVISRPLEKSLQLDDAKIRQLTDFMFRIFDNVFSKQFNKDGAQLSYWLAPVVTSAEISAADDPAGLVDWALLQEVSTTQEQPWTPDTPIESLIGRYVIDPGDGGKKFISRAFEPSLKPTDNVPEGFPRGKFGPTVLDYASSLWKASRFKREYNLEQPVLFAEKLSLRLNLLATPSESEQKEAGKKAYICPEPLRFSVLPLPVVTSCFAFPAIIHRYESYLIALEACEVIGVDCELTVALAAVTKDSEYSSEDGGEECITIHKGMGENYERLEFIGDTFLKTATTISTFINSPHDQEADLHITRMIMLCNKNLFETAKKLGLTQFVRSMEFSRRLWYPQGLKLISGKGVNTDPSSIKQALGDKTVADVCEALIGASMLSHENPDEQWTEEQWDPAVRAVTMLVDKPTHTMSSWDDYRKTYVKPPYQTGDTTAAMRDLAQKVELEHPYHFKYPRLLRSAFTHPSEPRTYAQVPSYERLEFLGDALLDQASIAWLFYSYPDKDPQWLTEHKMAMVSNKFLGAVCVDIGFHRHLRYASAILEPQIREYATELQEAKATAGGAMDYWTSVSDPPKCLADIVEAFVGAIFIDSDFNYGFVQDFFEKHVKKYFADMSLYDTFANNHPCTHLNALLRETYGCGDCRLMIKEVPAEDSVDLERKDVVAGVMVHDTVVSVTKGRSGRYARLRVAQDALERIQGLQPVEFRAKFGCQCSLSAENEEGVVGGGVAAEAVGAGCAI